MNYSIQTISNFKQFAGMNSTADEYSQCVKWSFLYFKLNVIIVVAVVVIVVVGSSRLNWNNGTNKW